MIEERERLTPGEVHQLWQAHSKLEQAAENLAQRIARGEVHPIVAYGDVSHLAQLYLIAIDFLGEVYAITYKNNSGKSCRVIVDAEDIATSMVVPAPSCTRVPHCPWNHGNEEISAG